ncbi:hypothetical protein V6N13_133884 [Hibiscus sabdariffa]|uniref:Uncharacterized protein n=1 Tax=Hibiscus sabdariffa TaxID=183260 RepID=A0ABR2QZX1_9ROSI
MITDDSRIATESGSLVEVLVLDGQQISSVALESVVESAGQVERKSYDDTLKRNTTATKDGDVSCIEDDIMQKETDVVVDYNEDFHFTIKFSY